MNLVVKAMKKNRNIYAALSLAGVLLAALFFFFRQDTAAIVCAVLAAAALVLLLRQVRLIYWAALICDSKLLAVPASIVTSKDGEQQRLETVVATFGLLLENKVYTWGCDGVNGVRLRKVEVDGTRIYISFGAEDELLSVELLHGMADFASVAEFAEKIRYETGVQAKIIDWQ